MFPNLRKSDKVECQVESKLLDSFQIRLRIQPERCWLFVWFTLPETNTSPLQMDGWNTIYFPIREVGLFSWAFAVSFRYPVPGENLITYIKVTTKRMPSIVTEVSAMFVATTTCLMHPLLIGLKKTWMPVTNSILYIFSKRSPLLDGNRYQPIPRLSTTTITRLPLEGENLLEPKIFQDSLPRSGQFIINP